MGEVKYARIISILKNGGIGVVPTDTIYGIVGRALSRRAVSRVYDVRARDADKPLIILITAINDVARFGVRVTPQQRVRLEELWRPRQRRKTSVVLSLSRAGSARYDYLHRGTHALAFRLVRTRFLTEVMHHTGPLVAPSANPQGLPPAQTLRSARAYFGERVDFYCGAARRVTAVPSRLVRLRADGTEEVLRA